MLLSTRKLSKCSLLSVEDIAFLKDIIIHRDEASNDGMGRKEAIKLIGETSQCFNWITCKYHWNNLVQSGKLKELKGGGKVVKAQQSTTKHTQITVEQQLCSHTNIDCGIEELKRLNQPIAEFELLIDHFVGNLDEASLMSNGGVITVVASREKKKTEKRTDNSRESITPICTGFASGNQAAYY